jgi:hypothetical protein
LINGSSDAGSLELSSAQLSAIGAITAGEGGSPICTATVIDRGLALTAAHCAASPDAYFRLGAMGAQVRHLVQHPSLDVVLFQVEDSAVADADIAAIGLLDGDISSEWIDREVTLAGIGQTETGALGKLRFVQEKIVRVTEEAVWVDGMGKSGACGGDSGGPLLVREGDLTHIAGVLSRGSSDCTGIDVYERGDDIATWVRSAAGKQLGASSNTCSH